jgi:beta-glucosidase
MMKNIIVVQMAVSLIFTSAAIAADSVRGIDPGPAAATPALAGQAGVGAYPSGPGGRNAPIPAPARPNPLPPFYDPKLQPQERADDIVSRLALEEKVALMQMASPAIPRLGIAPYHWWTEALHGMTHDTETVFPQAIGLAATWDANLHFQVASAISTEGRAKNKEYRERNIFDSMTGLDFWSPNVNIFRDPRWGRGQETYGEDPYLSGRFAVEFVKGVQGDDPVYFKAIATPKHYAVHSGPEALRHQFDVVITDEDLYTTYLPQFEAAIREGHAYSVMSAYSALNGVPDSCNQRLLTDILRKQWGFEGYVVSDDGSVADILNSHRYTHSGPETSALAVKAGNDLDSGTTYAGGAGGGRNLASANLVQAVQQGLITEKEINVAVGRIMAARVRMGEFDPPGYEGNPYNKITTNMYNTAENHALALKAAEESMVLLKNDNHALPIKPSVRTIAVIGPNADAINMQLGNYNGHPTAQHQISILDGIRQAAGSAVQISYSQGCAVTTGGRGGRRGQPAAPPRPPEELRAEALSNAASADVVIYVGGITPSQEGEQNDRATIELPDVQEQLIKALQASGKPIVMVNCSGSAIALPWESEHLPAILQAWYPGQRGDAVADVLFGKYNPAGRLPVTFYRATSDLPAFTNYSMVNLTYRYNTKPVLYPFGHGLSYSTFEYSGLKAPVRSETTEDVQVSVTVKNTSTVAGEEVAQCYLNRELPSIDPASLPEPSKMTDEQATLASTPRKTLVGFTRVPLKAGESKKVTFTITTQELSLVVGKDGKREVRPGNLQVQVGGSSANGPGALVQAISLTGNPTAPKYHFVASTVR